MLVKVKDEFTFFAPEAFTPDNDGYNEEFRVFGNGINNDKFILQIYDRWGFLIFESSDINDGWTGISDKELTQIGSYKWICIYDDDYGITHEESGTVYLIK